MAAYKLTTKRGYDFYEVASAFQKAIRRGDARMAGYWALELYDSGFWGFVWRRLHIIASEDIADPITREVEALQRSHDLVNKGAKGDRVPGRLMVVKAVLLLAAANKCRDADHLICLVYEDQTIPAEELLADLEAAKDTKEEIPDYALDMHTLRGRKMGRNNRDKFLKAEFEALNPRVPGLLDKHVPGSYAKGKQTQVFSLDSGGDLPPERK